MTRYRYFYRGRSNVIFCCYRGYRAWCFTNYDTAVRIEERLPKGDDGEDIYRYIVYRKEWGSHGGSVHLQGYVHFKDRKYFNWLRAVVGSKCRIVPAIATAQQNKEYCFKTEKDGVRTCPENADKAEWGPWEFGNIEGCRQGARTDVASGDKKLQEAVKLVS